MADIIQFSKYRTHKACVAAMPIPIKVANDNFSFAELNELQGMFAIDLPLGTPIPIVTQKALFSEAMEQAHIEMHGGPIDLSALPPIPKVLRPTQGVTVAEIRALRELVEKTRDHLADYLSYYKSQK
jgi:hypothetical protein